MSIRSAIPAGRDLNEKLLALLGDDAVNIGHCEIFVPIDAEAVSAEDHRLAQRCRWISA